MAKVWTVLGDRLAPAEKLAPHGARTAEPEGMARPSRVPTVMIVGPEHAADYEFGRVGMEVVAQLLHAAMPFAEVGDTCAVGVVVLPPAGRRAAEAPRFAFSLTSSKLVIVDGDGICAPVLNALSSDDVAVESCADVLCYLLAEPLREQPELLSRVRADFEEFEQLLLEGRERIDRAKMMADSRRMLGLDTFYQGLSDITGLLGGEDAAFMSPVSRARFAALSRQLDRLSARLESLQNYALQVNGLYQEGIDIRQNNVMQWLTVVTTIAMPLTVITGWYGMNFPHMGLIDAAGGYLLVACVCIVIVVAEVVFFYRRGWLRFGSRRRRR